MEKKFKLIKENVFRFQEVLTPESEEKWLRQHADTLTHNVLHLYKQMLEANTPPHDAAMKIYRSVIEAAHNELRKISVKVNNAADFVKSNPPNPSE